MAHFALMLALLLVLITPARAQAPLDFHCVPLLVMHAEASARGDKMIDLTTEGQLGFARGLFFLNPSTPAALPPGDSAFLITLSNGAGIIGFIDDTSVCGVIQITKGAVDILIEIGKDEITHQGKGL